MIERSLLKPVMLVSGTVWFGVLAIYVGISMFEGSLPQDLVQRAGTYSFSAILSFAAGIVVFLLIGSGSRLSWLLVFLVALVTLLIHAAFGVAIFLLFPPYAYLENAEFLPLFRNGIIYDSPIISSVFVGFIAIHYGRQLAEQQRLAAARESAARDAQLSVLRHQLSPHFLFNTLNSISALISEGDRSSAQRTVLMLSDFLRFSLETETGELVPLEEELSSVHAYLAIEHIRYEDRLQVTERIEDAAKQVLVPPFVLQPMLENVIKHAVAKVSRPVCVSLECSLDDGQLQVLVMDDGPGIFSGPSRSTCTGLRNLRKRLRLLYGAGAEITVSERSPHGVEVLIRFEARTLANA